MANKRIYLSSPHMGKAEEVFVKEAFDTNWISPLGANVDNFEKELTHYVGATDAAALVSGTAAIHLALKLLGTKAGDIVFCTSLTFAASCNPIMYENGIPIFIDSEPGSWNMSPKALEDAFKYCEKEGKLPKVVIVVHLYGQSADMDRIKEICNKYNTPIIEDAAESLGATYKGVQTGTMGKYGIYSFNGNKIITTSGGGMIVSNNSKGIEKAKFWAAQSREDYPYYYHEELGYNYRMSNVVAGIGRGQLRVLDERIAKKKQMFETYKEAFKDINEIEMMPICEYGNSNYWLSCITLKDESKIKPTDIMEVLAKNNIEARHIWNPMHKQPYYEKFKFFSHIEEGSVSEDIFKRGLCLPSDTKNTDKDMKRIISLIKELF
ncbi:DegT/DnrJ/EryC1/StrS family aminotransferase [Clostridium gasigenes]|uniref:DegT/DnrJ/EryC1/StrS family aminotransferase n=1 Tax=Clostridium gasigenes TaxID=94869 RepID=UPI0016240F57|nr:DegT/DnrJ/EryC1/StrS family aminotransferase [Clostridium gasigenes]MBB6624659.1 DegT/DnrJ/EryC1/StrS family aminotransferase [Clostridium gasigenes]